MKSRLTNRKLNFDKHTIVRLDAGTLSRINGGIELTEKALLTYGHIHESAGVITEPEVQGNDLARALPVILPQQL